MKKACIVIPTYNERANIISLIKRIFEVNKTLPKWDLSVLVVDDNSPDGTAHAVRERIKKQDNLYLIEGEKKGLGAAYIRGFEYTLKNFNPDFIFEMDGDLQHNPKDIPRFLEETENGYEFIIGSRYIPGADCPSWSFKRKVYSWLANLLARKISGVGEINDCTSGYRCISSKFLNSFDLKDIKTDGYAFQLTLIHAATRKKIKIKEIPILFPDRVKGKSKLGRKDIIEFFFKAFFLRIKRYHWK